MKCLVTGAAGFVGSHLVEYLLKQKVETISVDDLSTGFEENLFPTSNFFLCDLRNKSRVESVFKKCRPDVVFHFAADATEGRSQFTPVGCSEKNYIATLNTISSGIRNGMKKFVFASSMAVYGQQKPPFREEMAPQPEDIYGVSKAAAENAIKILAKVHNFHYTIFRPHNVYGPRQNMADPYRNVIAIFMNRFLKRKWVYIYGDGRQRRSYSYIDDIIPSVASFGLETQKSGQIFNLGADRDYSINQLFMHLVKIAGFNPGKRYLSARPQEVKNAFCSQTKAKRLLDYQDKTSLDQGLVKMWDWAKKLGPSKPKYIRLELATKLLPLTWKNRTL